jgi:hypothetical protein
VEPCWISEINDFGDVVVDYIEGSYSDDYVKQFKRIEDVPLNSIELSIFGHRFMSIAE